jgi:hypothetical protein
MKTIYFIILLYLILPISFTSAQEINNYNVLPDSVKSQIRLLTIENINTFNYIYQDKDYKCKLKYEDGFIKGYYEIFNGNKRSDNYSINIQVTYCCTNHDRIHMCNADEMEEYSKQYGCIWTICQFK